MLNLTEHEARENALILATDRMAQVAQKPLTRASANELRRLAQKVTELAGT